MRRGLVCLAVVAGLARGAAAAETWIEIRTTNFTVVSNAGESTARKTGIEFEQARAAYGKLWPWMLTTRVKPAIVVALKDEGSMRRWAPGFYEKSGINWVSGWSEGADRLYLLLRTDSRPDEQTVTPNYNLYRAYLRSVLSAGLERPFPEWLSNGLAGVLGNISVYDKEILIGRPVPWELRQFSSHARLPLQRCSTPAPTRPCCATTASVASSMPSATSSCITCSSATAVPTRRASPTSSASGWPARRPTRPCARDWATTARSRASCPATPSARS
jgi:hypothetical protein